jgi:hypothetical protein
MQMIIEAHLVDELGETGRVRLAVIDRELSTDPLGMLLAEGKALLAATQRHLVEHQCRSIAAAHSFCDECDSRLRIKGWHMRQIRTVFGRVTVASPRIRSCACAKARAGTSFSPLVQLVPARVTPELEYLQVKWAAHLSYGMASELLGEILPLDDSISMSGVKRRVRVVGEALERGAQAATRAGVDDQRTVGPEPSLSALAVDSAWLKHCDQQGRHVNLVAGRACFEGGRTRVYSYVHNQVASAAGRLDQFLAASGIKPTTRVTILTDGAGEFEKAAKGCAQPICRILDWFHISMKFKAAERSAFGCKQIGSLEREDVEHEIRSAKWLVWHGNASHAVARLHALDARLLDRPGYEYSTLWWNLHNVAGFVRNNVGLVNYARRHHKGLPVSSAIAESAVNQVVSLRMAKKRQMRWSDEGAHLLAQVRVHDINGELRPRAVPIPLRPPKPAHDPEWDAYQMLKAA